MIKNCFMDEQPDFYFQVKIDGDDIGTARHITDDDRSFIMRYANRKMIKDNEGNPVTIENIIQYDYDEIKLINAYILCAFGGTEENGHKRKLGQEGWNLNRECTTDNINLLNKKLKQEIFKEIMNKIKEFEDIKEDVSKN